jgi:hypothetical protein
MPLVTYFPSPPVAGVSGVVSPAAVVSEAPLVAGAAVVAGVSPFCAVVSGAPVVLSVSLAQAPRIPAAAILAAPAAAPFKKSLLEIPFFIKNPPTFTRIVCIIPGLTMQEPVCYMLIITQTGDFEKSNIFPD